MGKKRRILLVAFGIVLVSGVVLWMSPSREPVYQGKRLGQYLDDMASNYTGSVNRTDVEAVYQMGPEAIPYLQHALHRKDSGVLKLVIFLRDRWPNWFGGRFRSVPRVEYLYRIADSAAECLAAFGPVAHPAVPDLLDNFNDRRTMNLASYAVMQIGPKAEDLSKLLALFKPTNMWTPADAAACIGKIGVTNARVFSALIGLERDVKKPDLCRSCALDALGELGPKAAPAVPVLTSELSSPSALIRIAAASALWRIGGKTNAPIAWLTNEASPEVARLGAPVQFPPKTDDLEFTRAPIA